MTTLQRFAALTIALSIVGFATPAAAVPDTVSFTARLSENNVPTEGSVTLVISVFDAPTGGTLMWDETQTVVAERGLVYANLGSVEPLGPTVFDGRPMFVELTVEGDVLSPRIPVATVPYAFRAGVADAIEGFDPTTVQNRVTGACAAGSSIRQVNADGSVVCQTDTAGTGDITDVVAGSGLAGGGASGSVSLSVDTATIQARITSACAPGSSIRQVNADGTVICQADTAGTGDITDVTAGAGLTGGGATGAVALAVNTAVIQSRVGSTCAVGSAIRAINADGTVICQADTTGAGDITDVTAGTGLQGGGAAGAVALSIAAGGVGTTQLADNSVTTAKIVAGGVSTTDIATGAVTMSKTDAPAGYAAANSANGSSVVYPSGAVAFAENGACMVTAQAMELGSNTSFRLRATMRHIASNASVQPAEFVPSAFGTSSAQSGYVATSTAVLATNQVGNWEFGCEMPGFPSTLSCRVSWLCN